MTESDRISLINTLCRTHTTLVAMGLSRRDARTLLKALEGQAGTTALQTLQNNNQASDLIDLLSTALIASLQQRAGETEDDFHATMANMLIRKTVANRNTEELQALPGGYTVPLALWEAVDDLSLTLMLANGTALIDTNNWSQLDEDTKLKRLDQAYQTILDSFFAGNIDAAATFFAKIPLIGPAVLSICTENPASSPIRLPDGTAMATLSQEFTEHQTITLLGTEFGLLNFTYTHHLTEIESVTDHAGYTCYLTPEKSQIKYTCPLMQSQNGSILLVEPMHLTTRLTPNDLRARPYPNPVAADLLTPRYAAHDDLLTFALTTGNRDYETVLKALDALHAFEEAPSIEDAVSFHQNYISSGALACLGDIGPVSAQITQALLDRRNMTPAVDVCKKIVASLETIIADTSSLAPPQPSANEFRDELLAFIAAPTPEHLQRLAEHLFAPDGIYSRLPEVIPEENLAELSLVLERAFLPRLDDLLFSMKVKLIEFISRVILPKFIDSLDRRFLA